MRNILLVVGVAGFIGFFSACGSKAPPPAADDSTTGAKGNFGSGGKTGSGGKSGTGGKSGSGSVSEGGAGGDGGAGTANVDPRAPTVSITAPSAVDDPNQDGVLSGGSVTVTCEVTQSRIAGAGKVNQAATKISILGADGKVIEEKPATLNADDAYTTDFTLAMVPAGVVSFVCKGEDVAMHSGQDEVQTFLDKGPTITFVKPLADSAHALSQPLDVEFTVDASPLSKTDLNAEVADVTMQVAGQPIDLAQASDKPGHYRLQVNLTDPKLFTPPPSGPTFVTVTASDKRTPAAVKATAAVQTQIDGAGPAIQIAHPLDKDVVGGKVGLTFTVTDAISGVDPNTIVATLNMVDYPYDTKNDAWTSSGSGMYTFVFDSRQIKNAKVQITVNVGASDKVGNVSVGTSELLYLDNYPPSVDLDPLDIRSATTLAVCSAPFDAVGKGAKSDLEQAVRAGIFRSVVVDNTNTDPEVPIAHFSKINQGSVHLYLEEDSAKPLLVDKDKDGYCDDVAEVDSTNSLQLNAIPKMGNPVYDPAKNAADPDANALGCALPGPGATPLPYTDLCANNQSDMWQVIQDEYNDIPIIYGASPTPNTNECTGVSWEFGTKLTKNGWVCFASRAVDNVGNVGVSRPIRICVNDPDRGAAPACANSSVDAPSCTDGCTPPLRWGGGAVLWK